MDTHRPVNTVYNVMFDNLDGLMLTSAQLMSQWNEDLYFAVRFAKQKLSKYYVEVTPMMCMLRISGHISVSNESV